QFPTLRPEKKYIDYKDINKGIAQFKRGLQFLNSDAARANCAQALAYIYSSKFCDVTPDLSETIDSYEKGAAWGNVECMMALGKAYLHGHFESASNGIPVLVIKPDIKKAENLFIQALLHGHSNAEIVKSYAGLKGSHWLTETIK